MGHTPFRLESTGIDVESRASTMLSQDINQPDVVDIAIVPALHYTHISSLPWSYRLTISRWFGPAALACS